MLDSSEVVRSEFDGVLNGSGIIGAALWSKALQLAAEISVGLHKLLHYAHCFALLSS